MAAEDLILGFVCGAIGSLLLWVTIGRRMMLKYAGVSVARALSDPDDEMKEALDGVMQYLWAWLNTPSIEVPGQPDEEGATTKAIISPMQNVLSTMIDTIVLKVIARIRGVQGSLKKDANALESQLGSLVGMPLPRKGQTSGEFFLEQIGQRVMPSIEAALDKKLKEWTENSSMGSGGKVRGM